MLRVWWRTSMADPTTSTIGAGTPGEIIGQFENYDELIARLKERAAAVGLSYLAIDDFAGFSSGYTSAILGGLQKRHLSVSSLLAIARVLGVKSVMVVDPELTRRMQSEYGKRDAAKAHGKRLPKLGNAQIRRLLRPIAAEMGKRGGRARMAGLTSEMRRELGRHGARTRWQKAATMRVTPLGDPAALKLWIDEPPDGAPE
jgi:hypothetical protein